MIETTTDLAHGRFGVEEVRGPFTDPKVIAMSATAWMRAVATAGCAIATPRSCWRRCATVRR